MAVETPGKITPGVFYSYGRGVYLALIIKLCGISLSQG